MFRWRDDIEAISFSLYWDELILVKHDEKNNSDFKFTHNKLIFKIAT